MSAARLLRRGVVMLAIIGALAMVVGITDASAEALAPWWGLSTGARPTSLKSGLASSEVQSITVKNAEEEALLVAKLPTGEIFPIFLQPEETAEALQTGFETVYGAGNVGVTGGPSGSAPYIVTFKGALAFQQIPLLALLFPNPSIVISEIAQGKPDGQIDVIAINRGDQNANGTEEPVRIEDTLPPGLKAVSVEGVAPGVFPHTVPVRFSCGPVSAVPVVCTFEGVLRPFEPLEMRIGVIVEKTAVNGGANTVSASGGGASEVRTITRSVQVDTPIQFGIEENALVAEEAGGEADTQAGSHPFQVTSTLTFNHGAISGDSGTLFPTGLPRDVSALAPPGLIGNPTAVTQCTDQQFVPLPNGQGNNCPSASVVGVAAITLDEPAIAHLHTSVSPVFNMVPEAGEPARFGFEVDAQVPVLLDGSVRAGGDYGVTVSSHNISEIPGLISSSITLWGVPGDPRHDGQRGQDCLLHDETSCPLNESTPPPFLSMPTSCTGPLQTSVEADSWEHPHEIVTAPGSEPMPAMDGCNHLVFNPGIKVTPDVSSASSPTGLNVDVRVPQTAALNPEGLAEAYPKDITVMLPEGVEVNPAGGNGLQACSEGLAGFTGLSEFTPGVKSQTFTGTLPNPLQPGVNFCPNNSKVGTVKIKTPILPNPIEGAVYIAAQNENPFGSLIAMYLIAEDPVSGVLIKLAGQVHLTDTGQLVTTFENNPQAPFEDAELHFFGGERAPLSSPAHCGAYTTHASLTPWSGSPPSDAESTFEVTSGPHGGPCPGASLPFTPSLTGGTTNVNAGSFSPLTTTIGREDGNQDLQAVQLHMPPGLLGSLTGVALCGEAQANAGTCGPDSLIGETTISAGVGSDPVSVTGGKVYITGPYHGAPFGLSIVNPVKAGPFDLEHDTANPNDQPACDCIVVRAKVALDPHTAVLSVTTNTEGEGYGIPHMIDGIPVQIKKVNVLVNRPGFTFNPTDCNPQTLTGAISSDEGATSPVSVPFQVTNCAALKFAPKFAASTSGKTSKPNGASLSVKLIYPKAPFGTQSNIAKVKVSLPKRLPSRLTTLQKACTAKQFDANPGGCPAASIVGHARATTPLLPVPLEGPAYFVSHGGEAFPNLIMVLQGYGVTLDLVGDTFISKAGVTSSTFKTVPDAPVGSFELNLPKGPYSALAANGDLCKAKLKMPTEFVAQDGATIHQTTKIKVTGCHRSKHRKAAKRHAHKLKRARKG